MHTSTTLHVKQLIAYVYDFCARGDLCVRSTSFARKQLMLQGISWLRRRGNASWWYPSSRLRWPSMGYYTVLRPSWFVTPEDLSKGCDIPSFLCSNIDFRLCRPSRRMQSSVFSLWRSWLPIGPSFLSCLEASVVIFLRRWSIQFKPQTSPDDD